MQPLCMVCLRCHDLEPCIMDGARNAVEKHALTNLTFDELLVDMSFLPNPIFRLIILPSVESAIRRVKLRDDSQIE